MLETGTVHGLAFWFDVAFFGSQNAVWLSTSPLEPLTHWYQVRCLVESPLFVKAGQLLRGKVTLVANQRFVYALILIPTAKLPPVNTYSLKTGEIFESYCERMRPLALKQGVTTHVIYCAKNAYIRLRLDSVETWLFSAIFQVFYSDRCSLISG